jgi:hypothetical protein
MARPTQRSTINNLAKVADVLAANGQTEHRPNAEGPGTWLVSDLTTYTKKILQEVARLLELKGYSSMRKEELATRIHSALLDVASEAPSGQPATDEPTAEDRVARAKFDLGPDVAEPQVKHIPWGYGYDRITAMVINPEQFYVYWEVTDEAIAAARRGLGEGGQSAWLNLRVYDVTGRIFDGTNAHGYTDIKVERSDRQWFIHVGKPTSTHCVEIGMKSYEGYFMKIARSGRVEFPRRAPVGESPVAWLTVRPMSGEVTAAAGPQRNRGTGSGSPPPPAAEGGVASHTGGGWGFPAAGPSWGEAAWQEAWHTTTAVLEREWVAERDSFEWVGPFFHSRWEAGPFPLQIEVPGRVEERFEGGVTVYSIAGGKRVTFGPWQVVIRGLRGWAEGRVLGTWEVHKSWATEGGYERWGERTVFGPVRSAGGSELFGASERHWLAGSERRLGGASEVYRIGASEMLYGGASERLYRGASEYRYAGASEWRFGGASEWTYRGGSERLMGGASERFFRGASERLMGGSEHFLGGSEAWLGAGEDAGWGGSSDYRPPGGDTPQWPAVT